MHLQKFPAELHRQRTARLTGSTLH